MKNKMKNNKEEHFLSFRRLGSIWVYRFFFLVIFITGVQFSYSYYYTNDITDLIFGCIFIILPYIQTLFNFVYYDSDRVSVQNVFRERTYFKNEVLTLKPVRPWINLYVISFKDGKNYMFGLVSSKVLITENATQVANELEKELMLDL